MQQLLKMCDDKRCPPVSGLDETTGPPPGSIARLLLSAAFPTLAEFRARLTKAGLLDGDDFLTSLAGMTNHSFREHTTSSFIRVSLQHQQQVQTQGASARPLTGGRRASLLTTPEPPQHLKTSSSSRSARRMSEVDFLLPDQPGVIGSGGRRATGLVGPASRSASRRATEHDGPEPATRCGVGNLTPLDSSEDLDSPTSGRPGSRLGSFMDLSESSQSLRSMTDALAGLGGRPRSSMSMSRRQTEDSVQVMPRQHGLIG